MISLIAINGKATYILQIYSYILLPHSVLFLNLCGPLEMTYLGLNVFSHLTMKRSTNFCFALVFVKRFGIRIDYFDYLY